MGNCKTCKHWVPATPSFGECRGVGDDSYPALDGAVINATAADDTNLNTQLLTGPQFSCSSFSSLKD